MTREATVSLQNIAESAAAVAEYTEDPDRNVFVANFEPGAYRMLHELGEKPVGLEVCFRRRRFNHVATMERVIDVRRSAGGTSGAECLRRTPGVELFPEPWRLQRENPEPWP